MKLLYTLPGTRAHITVSRVSRVKHAHVINVSVPVSRRGEGLAGRLIRDLCDDADREDILLTLSAIASLPVNQGISPGLKQEQLGAWYQRHGFVLTALCDMSRSPAPRDAQGS